MRKRAEDVDRTTERITEAAVRLHTTIGPARTTVSAVAVEAGVTRLTVYRHFPDEESLFAACQAHWVAQHPPPDVTVWLDLPHGPGRARPALRELYAWYRSNEADLLPIMRDVDFVPDAAREAMRESDAEIARALVAGTRARGAARRSLRAAAGHVVSYWTWRSLAVEHGLSDDEAVELAVALLAAAER